MSTLFKLSKLQIDEIYDLFKVKNLKKALWALTKYLFFIAVLSLAMYLLFLQIFMLGFVINSQLISIVLLLTQIISLFFALGNIVTKLFYSKNNEFLLTMPASPNQIFLSKMLVIYVQEVIVNSIYTLPILLALGIMAKYTVAFYLLLPLFLLVLPLLPLSVAALLSIPAAKLLGFFKKHVAIASVVLLAVIACALYFYIQFLTAFTEFNLGSKQIETIQKINAAIVSFGNGNWLFLKMADGLTQSRALYWVLVYVGIGAAVFIGSVFLIRPFFFKTAMDSGENTVKRKAKAGTFKLRTPFESLIMKEVLTVFRSPGYVFQYFIFALLMPVIVVLYDKLLLTLAVNQTGQMMISGSHVLIVMALALLSNIISASAISREGGNFYIMKTAPVDYYTQSFAKIAFNALFTLGAVLITGFVTLTYLSPGIVISTTVAAVFLALGHICLCYDLDLKKPILDWYSSDDITAVSSNTTKSIIWALGLAVAAGVVIIAFSATGLRVLPWIFLVAVSVLFCIYRVYILILRISYQYDHLEM